MTIRDSRIRVLHVLGRMQRGGTEMRLLEVLRRLCPGEFHADVCALSGLPGVLDEAVRDCGGSVIPLPLNSAFPARFTRLLRRGRYAVVHSHVLHASGGVLALAAGSGVPVRIAHFRAMHDGRASTARRRAYRRIMLSLIDRCATDIVGCGEGAMNAIWRAGWRSDARCRIVYNAVDSARFSGADVACARQHLGIPQGVPVFLHVGNEVAEKNHARLLAIFAAIRRAEPSSRLVLAGANTDAPDGASSRAIARWGLGDAVTPLGVRDDVPRLLDAADVLLLPSLCEGLPGAVLEACAAGVPVLATDLPGVREIASRLTLVRHLPLTADDEQWAAAALRLPGEAASLRLRDLASAAFRRSAFHIDRSVEAYRELWGRAAPWRVAIPCS
jgi:glycosyltransferase involved in cell wall biosynthesis